MWYGGKWILTYRTSILRNRRLRNCNTRWTARRFSVTRKANTQSRRRNISGTCCATAAIVNNVLYNCSINRGYSAVDKTNKAVEDIDDVIINSTNDRINLINHIIDN